LVIFYCLYHILVVIVGGNTGLEKEVSE
jgi:hypothetical protein